jgi:hypothetical protein
VTLSPRERYIAIIVLLTVVLAGGYAYVYEPMSAWAKDIDDKTKKVTTDLNNADTLFRRETKMKAVWADLTASGLTADVGAANGQAADKVLGWMKAAGVNLTNIELAQARATRDGRFDVITMPFKGTGNSRSLALLIQKLETADIPVRINKLDLKPLKPGLDGLKIDLTISTLSQGPEGGDKPQAKPAAPAPAAGAGGSISRADFGVAP